MANASEPQTDRELLLKLNGEIEKLGIAIERFGDKLTEIEERKIGRIEEKLESLVKWQQQMAGAWRLFMIVWPIVTAIIASLIKYFL